MRIFILTLGTRGDVQPYVALGQGLQQRGHQVIICTSASFASFITGHGLEYGYMNDEIIQLIDTDAGREAVEESSNVFAWLKTMVSLAKQVKPLQKMMVEEAWDAAQKAQPGLIIYHPKAMAGPHIAEKMGIPRIMSVPLPIFTPTAEFPAMVFPSLPFGAGYNRLTYTLSVKLAWQQYQGVVNPWRETDLGLPTAGRSFDEMTLADGQPVPTIYPFSEQVIPRPADWPATTVASGYWFLDRQDSWDPPADLDAFLTGGPPPVYIGFGSMAGRDPQKKARAAVGGLLKSGQRGIIATGWGGLQAADLPPTIMQMAAVPHDWLFPRVAAVVHHGGAGTTAAGLRAGKPMVICPFFGDQPFWGRRVAELGVGVTPIKQKNLTAENLAAAIDQVTNDQKIKDRAATIGAHIRAEDGVGKAIETIQSWGYL